MANENVNEDPTIDDGAGPGIFGYFKKCMSNYANGNGRAQRAEYWSFTLVVYLILIPVGVVGFLIDSALGNTEAPFVTFALIGLVVLAIVIPGIALAARRLHDVGLSGWLYLISLVPYVGGLFMLVISLLPSQRFTNKYGPHPKSSGHQVEVFN